MGKVLDLGCAPGSWSQVMKELLPNSSVVGVDLLDVPMRRFRLDKINLRCRLIQM